MARVVLPVPGRRKSATDAAAPVRAEFVEPTGSGGRAGTTYTFPIRSRTRSPTARSSARREELHAAVARALEAIWAERTSEIAALLRASPRARR